ncbi:MAG: type II toxin-antitoxin system PemK/MazF family toxin [Mangrovibacterium sp.]
MRKGDIVLIPFPFTDLSGSKNRPAVILIESPKDVTVSFITSQLKWRDEHDLALQPSPENGLKRESILKLSKIATLDKEIVLGCLGNLNSSELAEMNQKLIALFKLNSD